MVEGGLGWSDDALPIGGDMARHDHTPDELWSRHDLSGHLPRRDRAPAETDRGLRGSLPPDAVLHRLRVEPRAVLRLQRAVGNRAVGSLLAGPSQRPAPPSGEGVVSVQLQRDPPGEYRTTKRANLRQDDEEHRIIRTLAAGSLVEVTDKGTRKSLFAAGLVKNEHSWVRVPPGDVGWVEDSKLDFVAAAQPAPVLQAPPQQAPPPPVQQPAAPIPLQPLYAEEVVKDDDRDAPHQRAFNHFRLELHKVGNRVGRPAAPLPPDVEAVATAAIRADMGAGGGDYGISVRDTVAVVVRDAHTAGYDIAHADVQSAIRNLATHKAGLGASTQIGEFQGKWHGGGF